MQIESIFLLTDVPRPFFLTLFALICIPVDNFLRRKISSFLSVTLLHRTWTKSPTDLPFDFNPIAVSFICWIDWKRAEEQYSNCSTFSFVFVFITMQSRRLSLHRMKVLTSWRRYRKPLFYAVFLSAFTRLRIGIFSVTLSANLKSFFVSLHAKQIFGTYVSLIVI